jgi:hypothetical protein
MHEHSMALRRAQLAFTLMLALVGCASWPKAEAHPEAEWTVMLYLNGDNNLESDVIDDFREAAQVGSSDRVNIIALLDRRGVPFTKPNWKDAALFRVEAHKEPIPSNAIGGKPIGKLDLGSGRVVSKFLRWTREHYPAKKYALVFSSHGTGMRLLHISFDGKSAEVRTDISELSYRGFYRDESSGHQLYVRELVDALRHTLKGNAIDLIGFDACVMGMTENAYALRDVAKVFVASEELVPESGWQYDAWLRPLVATPGADPAAVGSLIVASYKADASNKHDETRTLSVIDLNKINHAEQALTSFADAALAASDDVWPTLINARKQCSHYGCGGGFCFNHIDIQRFATLLKTSSDPRIAAAAAEAEAALRPPVIENYAGTQRRGEFGSNGLAIYFPIDRPTFKEDPYQKDGYETWNLRYPLEFVQNSHWPQFLKAYLAEKQKIVKREAGRDPGLASAKP